MKGVAAFVVVTVLLLAGCEYEVPLIKEHTVPVDLSVLGLWEYIPEEGEESDPDEIIILKFSDTEALIHYPLGVLVRRFRLSNKRHHDLGFQQTKLLNCQRSTLRGNVSGLHQRHRSLDS